MAIPLSCGQILGYYPDLSSAQDDNKWYIQPLSPLFTISGSTPSGLSLVNNTLLCNLLDWPCQNSTELGTILYPPLQHKEQVIYCNTNSYLSSLLPKGKNSWNYTKRYFIQGVSWIYCDLRIVFCFNPKKDFMSRRLLKLDQVWSILSVLELLPLSCSHHISYVCAVTSWGEGNSNAAIMDQTWSKEL